MLRRLTRFSMFASLVLWSQCAAGAADLALGADRHAQETGGLAVIRLTGMAQQVRSEAKLSSAPAYIVAFVFGVGVCATCVVVTGMRNTRRPAPAARRRSTA